MSDVKVTPANVVIMVSGAVIFIASFLAFFKPYELAPGFFLPSQSAWDRGRFVIVTLPALLGLLMAGQVVIVTFFRGVAMPSRLLGMTWAQVHLALGFQALVMMLAFLIQDVGEFEHGTGFWLMLIAAIGLFLGGLMKMRSPAGTTY
jgi:hypothetical protein